MSTTVYLDNPPPKYGDQARSFSRHLPSHIKSYFSGCLPIIHWLPQYKWSWATGDLLAAITLGAIVVPQSMAYAKLAGFTPEYGLYSSFVGTALYPFFGTSKDINIGTTAISSLFVGQIFTTIESTPQFTSGEWTLHQFATTMALLSGIILFVVSVLRLGILFRFICQPAIAGFMAGSGLTIVISQLPKILGVHVNNHDVPYMVFGNTLKALPEAKIDALIGILSLVWLYGVKYSCKYLSRRYSKYARPLFYFNIARNIIVLVFTTFLSWLINHFGHLEESPFQILGPVPSGFKLMGVPEIKTDLLGQVTSFLPSMVVLLIMEHCAISTSLGKKSDYRIEVNQEILSIGLTNIFGSFFSAYPSTGSFCRSAVNSKSGVRTPLSNILVAIIVVLALYVFTPAFQFIPTSSLAAVIAHAVTDLIVGPKTWLKFWRLNPSELVIFAAAYIICLVTRIDISVYVPVGLSLIVQLYRSARPKYAILGRLESSPTQFFSATHPTMGHMVHPVAPGVVCFQPQENLVFENSIFFFEKLMDEIKRTTRRGHSQGYDRPWSDTAKPDEKDAEKPMIKAIIMDLTHVDQMDYTAFEEIKEAVLMVERYAGEAVHWYFVLNDSLAVRKSLLLAGFGTQHRRSGKHGPFHSDLNATVNDDDDDDNDVDEDGPPQDGSSDDGKNKTDVVVIEDVRRPPVSRRTTHHSVVPQAGTAGVDGKDTIVVDVFPYFFVTMADAADAVVANHALTQESQIITAPELPDQAHHHSSQLNDEEKKIGQSNAAV